MEAAHLLYLTCPRADLEALQVEVENSFYDLSSAIKIVLYGETAKMAEGFLLFRLRGPLPSHFLDTLRRNSDICDYVILPFLSSSLIS
jgi:hypothetical protein